MSKASAQKKMPKNKPTQQRSKGKDKANGDKKRAKGKTSRNNPSLLKSLSADQKTSIESRDKSLDYLKKIQHKLDTILSQRDEEKVFLDNLKSKTKKLKQYIKETEAQLGQSASKDDLQKIKNALKQKDSQWHKNTDRLNKEISLLADLTHRVEHKITTLEQDRSPSNKKLLKRIKSFEEELNQFSDTFVNPEYALQSFERQLKKLRKITKQSRKAQQSQDIQINLLQANSNNIHHLLEQEGHNFQGVKNLQSGVEGLQQDTKSLQQETESLQLDTKSLQQDTKNLQQDSINLKTDSAEHKKEISQLKNAHSEQQEKTADIEQQLSNHKHDIANNQLDISDLQQTIKEQQADITQHNSSHDSVLSLVEALVPRLDNSENKHLILGDQVSKTSEAVSNLEKKTQAFKQELQQELREDITTQASATLLHAKKDQEQFIEQQLNKYFTEKVNLPLAKQQLAFEDRLKQYANTHTKELNKLDSKILAHEKQQQALISPINKQIETLEQELEATINALRSSLKEQIQAIADTGQTNAQSIIDLTQQLNNKSEQFNKQLEQSQQEIKQHIQTLHNNEQENNTRQLQQFSDLLDALSQQLSDTDEQSKHLLNSFISLQEQYDNGNEQHTELSKQFLAQQQQLEKHHAQLAHLKPIIHEVTGGAKVNTQQLTELSRTVKQLKAKEESLHSNVLTLAKQLHKTSTEQQENLTDVELQCDDQKNTLEQLSQAIQKRHKLLAFGLITVFALSSLISFTHNQLSDTQTTQQESKPTANLVQTAQFDKLKRQINQQEKRLLQLKTDIKKTNRTQMEIIKKQLSPVIAKQETKKELVPSDWKSQQETLKKSIESTQVEQQKLKKEFVQLSDSIHTIISQWQKAKNNSVLKEGKASLAIVDVNTIRQTYYGIQLTGALSEESIKDFIGKHALSADHKIIKTQRNKHAWYILIQGHYASFSQAKQALQYLPIALKKQHPWIKKLP